MFHFLRKSELVHDSYISENVAYILKYSPIQKATKFHPEWWKKLPLMSDNGNGGPTMKTCTGYVDLYKKSYILPLWSEFKINFDKFGSYGWKFADGKTQASTHNVEQYDGFADNFLHLKINSPWFMSNKDGVNWLFHQPTYNISPPTKFIITPGILEFKNQLSTNIQIFFDRTSEREIILQVNQPLIMMTPMTDKKIKMNYNVISEREYELLRTNQQPRIFFFNNYKKIVGLEENKTKTSSCPFHRKK